MATVNGAETYWERRGGGPRLLFCNGSGATLREARPLLDSLAGAFDVLAWDYRGLGGSGPAAGPYTVADLAADAAGLLDAVGWDACRVAGVSFGGMVALELAAALPGRVERLAVACTSSGGGGGSSYPLHELQALAPAERDAALLRLIDVRWDRDWLDAHPADRALAAGLAAGGGPRDEASAAGYKAQLEARAGHDVWDRLGAITCPTLVGYGEHDGTAPPRNSAAIASRVRGADLRGYAGGHLFLFQDPAALPDFEAFLLTPAGGARGGARR